MLDLRHYNVSEVGRDQQLQQRKPYHDIGLLRGSRPRGRGHCGSGVVASSYRVVRFVALSEVHSLGAGGVEVPE
ncbi:hypothetical protein NDU88_009229 [Pleurodeles waltl]|uniref:Uncharacterized protein n=1 Tax=Pleurodeles waltl TaxID=8319 RepID=A0AAV7RX01_PLEWA|nr:hypothetical protein NDU88_009229 [Pleurodeles waltl]